VSNFKDSTDQKACLLEIICNQLEREHWSKQIDDFLQVGRLDDSRIQGQRELVSLLGQRIQDQRKELGIAVGGW
jgi:hypothetical protein